MAATAFGAGRREIQAHGPVQAARGLLARHRFELGQFLFALNSELQRGKIGAEASLEARAIVEGELPPPVDAHELPHVMARMKAEVSELRATCSELVRRTTEHEGASEERHAEVERVVEGFRSMLFAVEKTTERYGKRIAELVDTTKRLVAVETAIEDEINLAMGRPHPLPGIELVEMGETIPVDEAARELGMPLSFLTRLLRPNDEAPIPLRVSRAIVEKIKAAPDDAPISFSPEELAASVKLAEDETADAIVEAFEASDERADTGTKRGA